MANELYPDLDNNFPTSIDNFDKFQDPNIYSLTAINKYYSCFNSGDLDGADKVLAENPQLKTMILDAERLNKIRDAIVSMERFYLSDFQKYIVDAIQYLGEYDLTRTYKKFSIVKRSDIRNEKIQTFIAIKDVPVNTPPDYVDYVNVNADTNVEYWSPISLKGQKGDAGIGLTARGEWKSNVKYTIDDAVAYKNVLYGCKKEHLSSDEFEVDNWYKIFSGSEIIVDALSYDSSQYEFFEDEDKTIPIEDKVMTATNIKEAIVELKQYMIWYNNAFSNMKDKINSIEEQLSDGVGGYLVTDTAPSNTKMLWIDSSNGGAMKYYNSENGEWTYVPSIYT